MNDRTDGIRVALLNSRKRSWVAKLDEAMDLLWKAHPSLDPLARAVLEDLRADMARGHPWPVSHWPTSTTDAKTTEPTES